MVSVEHTVSHTGDQDERLFRALLRLIACIAVIWGAAREAYTIIWFFYINSKAIAPSAKAIPFLSLYFVVGLISALASAALMVGGVGLSTRRSWARWMVFAAALETLFEPLTYLVPWLVSLRTYPIGSIIALLVHSGTAAILAMIFPALVLIILRQSGLTALFVE